MRIEPPGDRKEAVVGESDNTSKDWLEQVVRKKRCCSDPVETRIDGEGIVAAAG
jgi:hypothetical protein